MPLSAQYPSGVGRIVGAITLAASRVRRRRLSRYAVIVAAVAAATLLRWSLSGIVAPVAPFVTYYPAILVATILSGFWPGVAAVLLSALVGSQLFLPLGMPPLGGGPQGITVLFIIVAGMSVFLVGLLDAAIDRVRTQEANIRTLLESAPNGVVLVDEAGDIRLVNEATERMFGYARAELVGRNVDALLPEAERPQHRRHREAYQMRPTARRMGALRDLRGQRKDGARFPVEVGLSPIERPDRRPAVLATVIDITERQRVHAHEHFLMEELRHRSKNLFAVIQAIANMSFVEGRSVAAGREAFNGRLAALAKTHNKLAEADWSGAPLTGIISEELADAGGSVTVSGCDIRLNTLAAQQFALIVHELATNAMKYGALSAPGGSIRIEGRLHPLNGSSLFHFRWSESGGPTVVPPSRTGFGSRILVAMARDFGRNVSLEYRPEGLVYELQVDRDVMEAAVDRAEPPASTGKPMPGGSAEPQDGGRVRPSQASTS